MVLTEEVQSQFRQFRRKHPDGVYQFYKGSELTPEEKGKGLKLSIQCAVYTDTSYKVKLTELGMCSTSDLDTAANNILSVCLQQLGFFPVKKVSRTREEIYESYLQKILERLNAFRYRPISLWERLFGETAPRYTYDEWKKLLAAEEELRIARKDLDDAPGTNPDAGEEPKQA